MKEEKEAFIESLYLQYAGKLERASLNYTGGNTAIWWTTASRRRF